MYHIIYLPEPHKESKKLKGNGGNAGCMAGHRLKSLIGNDNILYGNGCLYHNHPDCFTCPREAQGLDCDFDYQREFELRKRQRENEKNPT